MTEETMENMIRSVAKRADLECAKNAECLAGHESVAAMTGPEALRFFAKTLRDANS